MKPHSDTHDSVATSRTIGEVDSEVRKALHDQHSSSLQKYSALAVGKPGWLALMNYELRTLLFSSIGGALGFVLRRCFYRRLWGRCGRGPVIGRNVTIRHPHRIHLGDNVVIDDHCVLDAKGGHIHLGDNIIIGRNTILSCKGGGIDIASNTNISVNCTLISETDLVIGCKVLIAGHCYIIAGGNHGMQRTDIPIVDQPMEYKGGVRIEDHVWLGANVTILDGVNIGRDSVVAAGSVVNRPLDAYIVAGGVPARMLRDRRATDQGNQP